ncbi:MULTISPECIES: hypothetical protein [unclassified Streptomyces]|uniref:hypothetical protein n=1 Tax=unclassified Streptomyces TaxID=2593676 RepID=UPI0033BD2D82
MRGTSVAARGCILAAVITVACCALPAPISEAIPWSTAALLAALRLACETAGRHIGPGSAQAGAE